MKIVTKALTGAALLYGVPLDEDQIMAYLSVLAQSGAAEDRLAAGVAAACQFCEFMPKPVDILKHMPSPNQKALPAADEFEMTPDDRAYGLVAVRLCVKYANKEITKDQMIAGLKAAAADLGIGYAINWDEASGINE